MFMNKVFTNSVPEHHPNTNTNMFTNMDILDPGSRIQDPGDPGSRILDPGSRVQAPGSWTQDPGSWILDPGPWIQDPWVRGSRIPAS